MILNRLRNSDNLLFIGLMMLAVGLPLSLFLTSLSQFFIGASLFLEGSLTEKLRRFGRNRLAILLVVLFLFHIIGLLWTSDMNEGLKDLRIKLPLLILTVVLSASMPLSKSKFEFVCRSFVASVFIGSMVSMAVYTGIIEREIQSIREIFIFNISHIRFSLFICLSIFILILEAFNAYKRKATSSIIVSIVGVLWFIYFLIFMESMTGMIILIVTAIIHLVMVGIRSSNKLIRALTLLSAIVIPLLIVIELNGILKEYSHKESLQIDLTEKTMQGNPYTFLQDKEEYENGFPIWVYICEQEMRPAWNKVSVIQYDSLDERRQALKYTLIRFLTSKGLRKDAEGIAALSSEEIKSIERGIANVKYQNLSDARIRLVQIIWEFDQFRRGSNPSGHSVTQRFEFWKAAKGIIASHPIIGVGTGDMPASYREQYNKMKSPLEEKFRLRAHNQYLALAVGLGIPVMIYFILFLVYSIISQKRWNNFLFLSFWIIAVLSMLTEDTLETQSGVTFFAFFFCFLAFYKPQFEKD